MSYLSASLRFCWPLLSIFSLLLASTSVSAEDKLAVTFELPIAHPTEQQANESLVRYQESLPPISSSDVDTSNVDTSDIDTKALKESEAAKLEAAKLEAAEPEAIEVAPSKSEDMALRFAQDDLAMPFASGRQQSEKVDTIAAAFTLDRAAESLLAATPDTHPTRLESDKVVKSLQQRLAHSPKNKSALNAANILKADILEDWIYEGGSDSLVARTVGSAEGTRRSDGQKTMAYYGHTDPGNGVWNLGTFSYQHGAVSPEEADEKQLRRLQHQELQLKERAAQWNVPLSIEVRLNGLDLANQAPLAALDRGGYIERLAEAYKQGKSGEAAIVWARTQAYFDPERQDWDAPGLGNNPYSIQRDQERRMAAIDQAFRAYKDENLGQLNGLHKLPIISANATMKRPLLSQSKPIAAVDFSLESDFTAEPADVELSDASVGFEEVGFEAASSEEVGSEKVQAEKAQVEELQAEEANTLVSDKPELDDSLVFEDDRIALGEQDDRYEAIADETNNLLEEAQRHEPQLHEPALESREQPIVEERPVAPQNQLPLLAPLGAEATSEVAIETAPAEVAASTETADGPKFSLRKEK
ncbi:MAG: hypothetical protein WA947_18275 [Phormidesmis sp.]